MTWKENHLNWFRSPLIPWSDFRAAEELTAPTTFEGGPIGTKFKRASAVCDGKRRFRCGALMCIALITPRVENLKMRFEWTDILQLSTFNSFRSDHLCRVLDWKRMSRAQA